MLGRTLLRCVQGAALSSLLVIGIGFVAPTRAHAEGLAFAWVDKNAGDAWFAIVGDVNWWGSGRESRCSGSRAGKSALGTWNDCASSIFNPSTCDLLLYKDVDYGGPHVTIPPGQVVQNLKSLGMNDAISSSKFVNCR